MTPTILGRLSGVKREGAGWKARCPAHDDRDPSLSVSLGDDRRTLLHCFAGCTADDIVAAVGMQVADLFEPQAPPGTTRKTRYELRDVNGTLVATKVRVDYPAGVGGEKRGKSFYIEPSGIASRDLPLYGAHKLDDAGLVVLTEGEKAAQALLDRGFQAAGTACGAAVTPSDDQLLPLLARPVVLWPDNDPAGLKHMEKIATRLGDLGHDDVCWLTWPDAPPKGDAADHHGTDAELVTLIEGASTTEPPKSEPTPERNGPRPLEWGTFWTAERGAEWLLEPLLPARRAVAMFSPPGTGKSLLGLDLAARLATGRRVFDRPSGTPEHVVYLDLEMTEDDVFERLDAMGYGPDSDLSRFHYFLLPDLPPLDTADGGEAVASLAREFEAALVVIDTTSRVISGGENDSDTVLGLYRHTVMPLKREGCAVLRFDHAGKDLKKGQRGTSAKSDDVDLVWELTRRDDGGLRARATKRRQSWIPEEVDILRLESPVLRHERAATSWPEGTERLAALLDALGVPVDATNKVARDALKAGNHPARNDLLAAAIRYRKSGNASGNAFTTPPGNGVGNDVGTTPIRTGNAMGNAGEWVPEASGNVPPLYEGNGPSPLPGTKPKTVSLG